MNNYTKFIILSTLIISNHVHSLQPRKDRTPVQSKKLDLEKSRVTIFQVRVKHWEDLEQADECIAQLKKTMDLHQKITGLFHPLFSDGLKIYEQTKEEASRGIAQAEKITETIEAYYKEQLGKKMLCR